MKAVTLMIMALLGLAFAQQDTTDGIAAQWTDTLVGAPGFRGPNFGGGTCQLNPTPTVPYRVVNVTTGTGGTFAAGVREVLLLADAASFVVSGTVTNPIQVYLYSPYFDPNNACNNLVRNSFLVNANQNGFPGSYVVDDPVYLNGTYAFVITTAFQYAIPATTSGAFGLAFLTSAGTANSAANITANQTWVPSQQGGANCIVISGAPLQNFTVINFFQSSVTQKSFLLSGIAATLGSFGNSDMYWSIYQGTFTPTSFIPNSCAGTVAQFIRKNQLAPARIAPILPVTLTATDPYTVAISAPFLSYFGFTVIPTPVAAVTPNPQGYPDTPVTLHAFGWNQPNHATPCVANTTATNTSWALYSFTAGGFYGFVNTNPGNLFFSYYNYTTFPSYTFVYTGLTPPATGAPAACPTGATLVTQGSADVNPLVFSTTAGTVYTVIISQSNPSIPINPNTGAVFFSVFSGQSTHTTPGLTTGTTTGNTTTTSSAPSLTIPTLCVFAFLASLLF